LFILLMMTPIHLLYKYKYGTNQKEVRLLSVVFVFFGYFLKKLINQPPGNTPIVDSHGSQSPDFAPLLTATSGSALLLCWLLP